MTDLAISLSLLLLLLSGVIACASLCSLPDSDCVGFAVTVASSSSADGRPQCCSLDPEKLVVAAQREDDDVLAFVNSDYVGTML